MKINIVKMLDDDQFEEISESTRDYLEDLTRQLLEAQNSKFSQNPFTLKRHEKDYKEFKRLLRLTQHTIECFFYILKDRCEIEHREIYNDKWKERIEHMIKDEW